MFYVDVLIVLAGVPVVSHLHIENHFRGGLVGRVQRGQVDRRDLPPAPVRTAPA